MRDLILPLDTRDHNPFQKKHMAAKRALITGQDGSYLAELLLSKGYEVHGMVRRVALEDPTINGAS